MASESIIQPMEGKFETILLFGPPGSGKGTLGRVLADAGGHYHLSSGDIFRGLDPDTPAGAVFHSYAMKGHLVPDDVTMEIYRYFVAGLVATNQYFPERQFLLLDGIPRTPHQAEMLDTICEVKRVIVLEMKSDDTLVARLKRRATIEKRPDDAKEEVLRRRLEVYKAETGPLLAHYPEKLLVHINADQRPLEVLRDVLGELAPLLSEHYQLAG